jgi:glycosyltransferase involved in cell wall biosynthesis
MKTLKVIIYGTNSATEYSGGRYCAWMMAEALAECGHEVTYISNAQPLFCRDFTTFPRHHSIKLHISKDMDCNILWASSDFVILVPDLPSRWGFYLKAQLLAATKGAKLVLLNFETPNWFNQLSPHLRDEKLWVSWKRIAKKCSVILSISGEGDRYAHEYYVSRRKSTVFDFCYPGINSVVAGSVPSAVRKKRIIWIGRFGFSEHKGTYDLPSILCKQMRGHTLVMIKGSGVAPPSLMKELNERADEYGVTIEVKQKLSDWEKFEEFKRARLLLFPSQFEGFGLPPVEALYCNLPCVAFDLPVLREVCGDALLYARRGDWVDFRNRVARALQEDGGGEDLHAKVASVASFESYADRLNRVLQKVVIEGQCGPNLLSRKFRAMSLRSQLLGWGLVQSNRKNGVHWLSAGRKGIIYKKRMSAWVLHCGVRFMQTILPLKLYALIQAGYRKRRMKW